MPLASVSEPFNCRFLSIFAKASRAGAPSYSEGSLKQKIEIMGELNASGIGLVTCVYVNPNFQLNRRFKT